MKKYKLVLLAIIIIAVKVTANDGMWLMQDLNEELQMQIKAKNNELGSDFVYSSNISLSDNQRDIAAERYVPRRFKIGTPPKSSDPLKVITIFTEGMYGNLDPVNLGLLFREFGDDKYYGLETEYSRPLTVRIYMDMDEPIDEMFLKELVEKQQLILVAHGQEIVRILDYKFKGISDEVTTFDRREFLELNYDAFKSSYKTNSEKYGDHNLTSLIIPYPELELPLYYRTLPYLSSYLSLTDGVISMETFLDDSDQVSMKITYSPSVITENELWDTLCSDTWEVISKDGEIKRMRVNLDFDEKRGHAE